MCWEKIGSDRTTADVVTTVEPTAGSERRACRWLGFHRTPTCYVPTVTREDAALRRRLRELATANPGWGAPLLISRLRQEGVTDTHKRFRRLYRLEGLIMRHHRRKRVAGPRTPLPPTAQPDELWAMDSVRDTLASGASSERSRSWTRARASASGSKSM